MPVFKCCDDPDCAGRRVSKRKWCHDAFVAPPYPLGVNPYLGYPPVFGSRMQMSAAAADEYKKRCGALDRRCDEPADFIVEDSPDAAAKFAAMHAELMQLKLEKDALKKEKDIAVAVAAKAQAQAAEAGATAVAPGSGKKVNYTKEHPDRHAAAVLAAAPVLLELKKLANNSAALWWVAKHCDALNKVNKGERADWFESYVKWGKSAKIAALNEYMGMGWDADAGAGEDDE
jgi:hypothetical protein